MYLYIYYHMQQILKPARLWDKSRELRPSIFEKPKFVLPSRAKKLIHMKTFSRFFDSHIAQGTLSSDPYSVADINLLLAKIRRNSLEPKGPGVQTGDRVIDFEILTIYLAIRIMVDPMNSLIRNSLHDPDFITINVLNSLKSSGNLPITGQQLVRFFDLISFLDSNLQAVLHSYLVEPVPRGIVNSTLPISEDVLDEVSSFVRLTVARDVSFILSYPFFSGTRSRLVAILGQDVKSSFYVSQDALAQVSSFSGEKLGHVTALGDQLNEEHIAMVLMYPWEACHIKKALEMQKRGIRVVDPLGTILVDELEFALFGWVKGTTLHKSEDQTLWHMYGKLIRTCHDRGIAVGDAAGRNVIWTGKDLVALDFEHTWFMPSVFSVPSKYRSNHLSRIEEELSETPRLYRSFIEGYSNL